MEAKNSINLILEVIGLVFFGALALLLLIIKEFGLVVFLVIIEAIIGAFVLNTKKETKQLN